MERNQNKHDLIVKYLGFVIAFAALFFTLARWHAISSDPLTNDDKNTNAFAVAQKAEGHLPTHGLAGTTGITYGPVAILLYQTYAAISPVPLNMRRLQVTLVAFLMGLGVWLLILAWRGYVPWFDPLYLLLIPVFWAQGRTLWDLTIIIPLSLLAMATYLLFIRTSKLAWLAVCFFTTSLMLNSHLMAMPWAVGVGLSFLVFHRSLVLEKPKGIAVAALALIVPLIPYARYVIQHPPAQLVRLPYPFFRAWEEKFFGGFKVLSSVWAKRFCEDWEGNLGPLARFIIEPIGLVVLVFAFAGLYQAGRRLQKKRTGDPFLKEVSFLSLAVTILCFAQQVIGRLPFHHLTYYYYYASWPAYSNLLFLAWHQYQGRRWYLPLKIVYWFTLILSLIGLLKDPVA